MPPSSTSSSDLGRLARALQLTLVAWIAIEVIGVFLPETALVRTYRWMRARIVRLPAPTVQIHGDSVAQSGLFASEVLKSLPPGITVDNRALQGSGPEFTYFLLKRQIDAGRVPRAIIYAHSPHTLTTTRVPVMVGAFLDLGELPELAATGQQPYDILYGLLCRVSFTLRHRDGIRALLKARREALVDFQRPIPTESTVVANETIAERHPRPAGWGTEPLHETYRRPFVVHPLDRMLLARTLALAKAHGVTVYWFPPLEHPLVHDLRDSTGFERDYGHFVDSLAALGEIVPLRRRIEVGALDDFGDYLHLRLATGMRESRALGDSLAHALAAGRGAALTTNPPAVTTNSAAAPGAGHVGTH